MRKLLTTMIDVVFPPTDNSRLLRTRKFAADKLYQPGYFKNIKFLSNYSEPIIKSAMKENKFHKNEVATKKLAELLDIWIKEQPNELVFIPIPLSKKRHRIRGYNQVTSVLNELKSSQNIEENILLKTRDTIPQTKLTKTERETNLSGCFSCCKERPLNLTDTTIVIIDDVVTTGTTINEARATLAPHLHPSTKLICLAIAH